MPLNSQINLECGNCAVGLIGVGEEVSDDDRAVLVRNIEKLLLEKGLTQADLARGLGISSSTVSLKLAGKRDITVPEAGDIARFLGTTLSALTNPDLVEAKYYSNPEQALEAIARHFGRETRPRRNRGKKSESD